MSFRLPEGASILEASGKRGTGNILLLMKPQGSDTPCVLKVYRTRRSRTREVLRSFAQTRLEGKRGASAQSRCETERASIAAWRDANCDVVDVIDAPLPAEITEPSLWLTYYDLPLLSDQLRSDELDVAAKYELIQRLSSAMSRRHDAAVAKDEPLLIHEHGNVNHYFVDHSRLIAFDLENGYRPGFPVLEAIAQEIASTVRSMERAQPNHAAALMKAFADGYDNRDRLAKAISQALDGEGMSQRLKRWHDDDETW